MGSEGRRGCRGGEGEENEKVRGWALERKNTYTYMHILALNESKCI